MLMEKEERVSEVCEVQEAQEAVTVPAVRAYRVPVESSILKDNQHALLEQRLHELANETAEVNQQIQGEQAEYQRLRAAIVEDFDERYADEIERDEAFHRASGVEFEGKYLQHRFGKIRAWAMSNQRLLLLGYRRQKLAETTSQLEEDRQHMTKTPAELYRMIQELREQVMEERCRLRNQVRDELRDEIRKEMLNEIRNELRDELRNELRSEQRMLTARLMCIETATAPRRLICGIRDHGVQSVENSMTGSLTAIEHTVATGYRKAIGTEYFPRDFPSIFTFKVVTFPPASSMCVGLIGAPLTYPAKSFTDPSSYGWGSAGDAYIGGQMVANHEGWPNNGWLTGDMAIFRFDPAALELCMFHLRLNRRFTITIASDGLYRLHFNLFTGGTRVEVVPTTFDEVLRAGFV